MGENLRPASAKLENSPQFPWKPQALVSCSALETLTVSSVVIRTDFSRDNQSTGNPRHYTAIHPELCGKHTPVSQALRPDLWRVLATGLQRLSLI